MAAKHEIQNLIRRGNVFYWKPRIPRNFNRTTGGHISLSLRQPDHMKARYMARRLNTLLHGLRLKPEAALTTRDQFEALFRAEIERMGSKVLHRSRSSMPGNCVIISTKFPSATGKAPRCENYRRENCERRRRNRWRWQKGARTETAGDRPGSEHYPQAPRQYRRIPKVPAWPRLCRH